MNIGIKKQKKPPRRKRPAGERRAEVRRRSLLGEISPPRRFLCLVSSLRVGKVQRRCAAACAELRGGEPRCWSVFTASAERKGGRARADDLEGVQRQGPRWGRRPSGGSSHCLSLPTLLLLFYPLPQHCFHFPFLSAEEDERAGIISYQRQPLCYLLTGIF